MTTDLTFQELIDTANLFLKENELEKSIENYGEALNLASTIDQKVHLCNVLGRLYQKTGDEKKAIAMFNESIQLYELLDDKNLTDKAAIYNNLGALYAETDYNLSIKNHSYALKVYKDIYESGMHDYSLHLANTKFALAEIYLKINDYYQSKKHYKEAIKLYDMFKSSDFDELKASAYYQIGNIYTEEFNLHDAKINYLKALALFENLYETDNFRFQPFLAATYNNLGVTFKSMDDHQKAIDHFQKALHNYVFLSEHSNQLFLPYVAATNNSLAILYAELKNIEMAIEYSLNTTSIYNDLVNQSPEEYTHYLATSLHNLGLFYFELKKLDLAENSFQEALKMRKRLANDNPEYFDADVSATALNLLEVYQAELELSLDMGYKKKCMDLLEDVEARLQKYSDDRPVLKSMKSDCKYYRDYLDSINLEALRLSNTLKKVDDFTEEIDSTILPSEKITFQIKIVKLLEDLYKHYPKNNKLKNELAYAYSDLSWLNLRLKNFKEAENIIKKAQVLDQPIISLKCNFAHSLLLQGKFKKAKDLYLEIKNEKNSNNEPFAFTILKDFNILKADGIDNNEIEKVKSLIV